MLECEPNMKVTYNLSTSECMSSHSRKSNHSFLITHLALECEPNIKVTYSLRAQVNAWVHTTASGEESNCSILITHLVLECEPNRKITYFLSTSECMSSYSSKWRKEQSIIFNHTSCVRMLTKYQSNLQTEYKWMHEFTQQ